VNSPQREKIARKNGVRNGIEWSDKSARELPGRAAGAGKKNVRKKTLLKPIRKDIEAGVRRSTARWRQKDRDIKGEELPTRKEEGMEVPPGKVEGGTLKSRAVRATSNRWRLWIRLYHWRSKGREVKEGMGHS